MAQMYKVDQLLEDTSIIETAKMLGIKSIRGKSHCFSGKHTDKEPSMLMYERNKRYTCRACGATGRTLDMVQIMTGLNFQESCEWLIKNFGLNRDNYVTKSSYNASSTEKNRSLREYRYVKPEILKQIGIISTPVRAVMHMHPEDAYKTFANVEREYDCCISKDLITRNPLQELFENDTEAYEYLINSCAKEKLRKIQLAIDVSKLSRSFLNRKPIQNHLELMKDECRNAQKELLDMNKKCRMAV